MYYYQDANMYEKVTSVISWNCLKVQENKKGRKNHKVKEKQK